MSGDDEIDRLRSLVGVKWARYPAPVLPAWVADMDFDPASVIKEAMFAMVGRGDLGYAFGPELIDAWCDWQERHHQWRPPEEEVRAFTGALHAMEMVLEVHTEPGDGVAIFTPMYHPFRDAIKDSRRRVVDVPLDPSTWRLDAERLESVIDSGTRILLFCQPHNPVGRVFDQEELSALADVAQRHDLLVVSDEIWGDLTHEPHRHLPLHRADERFHERLITLGAASKAFNIAGLRCSVAHIDSPSIRESFAKFSAHVIGSPSSLSAAATVAAWTKGEDWLAATRSQITSRRDRISARLGAEAPGIGFWVPEATYLGWLDFTETSLGDDPAKVLYQHADVALQSGEIFGTQGIGHARINFATTEPILDEILDRIIKCVSEGVAP